MTASTDPLPAFPGLVSNPGETYQADIIVCAVITWVIGALFVGLRFYARGCLLQGVIGVEDWLMIVALVFSGATCAGMIEQAVYGLGKHFLDINPVVMVPMVRAGWYTILWYMLSLLATKTSILLLYLRVLSFRHARYAVYGVLATVLLTNGVWTLYTVLTACTPLHAFWDLGAAGSHCRPESVWYANTALHIGTDVLMYVLPLPVVVRLQIGARRKLALYAVLALGLFVCLISAVRLWDLTMAGSRADYPYDNVSISYLTVLEINAAIACACCMTLRPLMNKLFPRFWGSRSGLVGQGQGQGNGNAQDIEAGAAARARLCGAVEGGRGPPTIGSTPSRKVGLRRDGLDNSRLLEGDDEGEGGDEKRSMRTNTDSGSFSETGSGTEKVWTLSEPQPVYAPGRRDADRI